jgi:maltooligosyltrehalose trehalohydrolase
MGQEYAEGAPFLYFVSHTEPELVQAVQEGRKREFKACTSSGSFPNPQDERTFLQSKLHWEERTKGSHGILLELYRRLMELRRSVPALRSHNLEAVETWNEGDLLMVRRSHREGDALMVMNFGSASACWTCHMEGALWRKALNTAAPTWGGPDDDAPDRLGEGEDLQLFPTSLVLYRT